MNECIRIESHITLDFNPFMRFSAKNKIGRKFALSYKLPIGFTAKKLNHYALWIFLSVYLVLILHETFPRAAHIVLPIYLACLPCPH